MADDHAGLAALQTYYLLPAQVSYARACLLPPPPSPLPPHQKDTLSNCYG